MAAARTHDGRRWTAEERRAVAVQAAIEEFAGAGLAGASTEAIARRAGISHAYLFRLFATKRALFIAAVERSFDRVRETFEQAERERGDTPRFPAFGAAYGRLLQDRSELQFQMHAYAACADADVRAVVRRKYMEIFRHVRGVAGLSADMTRLFMATGLLMTVSAAIAEPELSRDGSWMSRVLAEGPPGSAPASVRPRT